jgi:hypothetical protein
VGMTNLELRKELEKLPDDTQVWLLEGSIYTPRELHYDGNVIELKLKLVKWEEEY